ncbi:3 beta-hydroxysteroid dehydrogenase/Delta 5--_4-isomerase [Includes: 3-beta-hydroxy-Delta(5)-steroid dehydrogenase; Steroid Delta-isomerase] [Sterolibacterium denitrificans]|uniref:3 beta-hydroxysteroid dehydrogenase/Delta 5-->4-isomerase n=2 Tax=Sterolibacterium denitrificans TaxID=157592 RepID=A0A7Z7HNK7_9PROT|nr:NAD-dependent epimerase/dehydratase family protein [Sterolibacterium denitrificans]KYC28873.1 steroid delta-isomerase [Sterolibacterium denitrificans]SMB21130.1 3 beta-hydroxysteroid dehydrogenase/Delta 5-->4-isomerase [Includes: 3-beta-hydroxy-Delta(5)-steroid dehydrogenase; Steroid Delta-isomerase] [Sterolibacterium denitrificans]
MAGDFNKTTDLGRVLVTGGSGFVGCNFVKTLLAKGYKVRSFDLAPSPLPAQENLEIIQGNICDRELVRRSVQDIDTIFHTAAIIELKGGSAVTQEYRDRSYAINVEATKNLLQAGRAAGAQRFVYTASNSVVIGGQPIVNGDETLPYTERFNDLYTETKVVAEKWVLEQNGQGILTCSIRPSGIWGEGDQTMFRHMFNQMIAGLLRALVGSGKARLDNSYVHNLIHGHVLAAQHLVEGGTSPGQAYFINDGEPINMFDFSRPVVEAVGYPFPKMRVPAALVKSVMAIWQALHFKLGIQEPPVPPLAIERIAIDNFFSIDKARRDLGYEPLYNTEQGIKASLPYYVEMYNRMKLAAGK